LGVAAVPVAEEQANIVLTRAKLMPASFIATRLKVTSNTCRNVSMREIVAFEEQRGICGLGERVGGAIGQVEPRLRIDAFAVTIERRERFARLGLVEGNDLEIYGMEAGTAALIYMILRNFENFDLVILTHLMGTPNRAVA
jgi:hypothetical protein